MVLENYCRNCGKRILPNDDFCPKCGNKTVFDKTNDEYFFTYPIYDVGFFNFDIDFSPYIIDKKKEHSYEICSCGYLNKSSNKFCYKCGKKIVKNKLNKFIKFFKNSKRNLFNNITCSCGHVNSKDNLFCEMCGLRLNNKKFDDFDHYRNFKFQYENSVICFCGEENDKHDHYCKSCGFPLTKFSHIRNKVSIICVCSAINNISARYCLECGLDLSYENQVLSCVCGTKNPLNAKFCQNCERPLNPKRLIKSKVLCSCGTIIDYSTDFCPTCGKNISKYINNKNNLKKLFKKRSL